MSVDYPIDTVPRADEPNVFTATPVHMPRPIPRRRFLHTAFGLGTASFVSGAWASDEVARADESPCASTAGINDELLCRAKCGNFGNDDSPAVMMALEDLRAYWEKAFGAGTFLVQGDTPEREADMELLIGSVENLPRIRALVEEGKVKKTEPPDEGFALDILTAAGKRTAVLHARDRLGLQYAIYGFAEQYLGVRFVHPLIDMQPDKPPMPAELHVKESPSLPLRALTEGGHVRCWGLGNRTDIGSWRREDWEGNAQKMRRFIAWGVKNRVNTVVFDDAMGVCAKAEMKPFVVSDALWRYLDARGLKTIMWCGPGYTWGAPEGAYRKQDLCNHDAPRVGFWDKHLCVNKPGFWQETDDWLDLLKPHAHRLAGIFTNWQENVCGEGVTEGAEDGVIHSATGQIFDMNSARFRKPVLSKGGGCTSCGHMENVDKWVKHIEYLKKETAARGQPPVGITRTFWGVAAPDDGMVAKRVVPNLPPGSVSKVACLPGCHAAQRVEAWPRIMDEVNRADNGNRRIMLYRELGYACGSDMPVVPLTNLDRIDDDFQVFGKYDSFAGALGGVMVYYSMGWLFTLYSMRKQWQAGSDWRSWFQDFFRGLLSDDFSKVFLQIAATIQDVQLLEGLEPGEEPGGYYSRWALNLYKLAPETLSVEGPLKVDEVRGQFLRLVKAGAADPRGVYTSERCAPALKRILSLRSKIEHVIRELRVLRDAMPAGADGEFWNEHVLLPLRLTAKFLQARVLLAQSYMTYVRMREGVLKGQDMSAAAGEGETLCRQALEAQEEYIRLRPWCPNPPKDVRSDTLRTMIAWWKRLATQPQLCRDLDICAFLDRVEADSGRAVMTAPCRSLAAVSFASSTTAFAQ